MSGVENAVNEGERAASEVENAVSERLRTQ